MELPFTLLLLLVSVIPQVIVKAPTPLSVDPTKVLKLDSEAQIDVTCLTSNQAVAFIETAIVTYSWSLLQLPPKDATLISVGFPTTTNLSHYELSAETRTNTRSLLVKSFRLKEAQRYLFVIEGTVTQGPVSLSSEVCLVVFSHFSSIKRLFVLFNNN